MNRGHGRIIERVKAARARAIVRYVHGKQVDERLKAAREQAIISYGYGRRG
ncbi:MAG TPA: hypothetical protein VNF07_06280 [Acidimicrobiales bacterium]|nr:hypothetical protein [Acidimicrobiales bacterium]